MANSKKISQLLSLLFFILGTVLLFFMIKKVGLLSVVQTIQKMGFKIVFVLVFPVTWTFIQSLSWWRLLKDSGETVPFLHIVLAKITGETINTITPVSFMGGDPYRIYMLQKVVSKTQSAASVIIDRTMYTIAVILILAVSMVLAWFYLPLPSQWHKIIPLLLFIFFLTFVFLILFQKKGMFSFLSRMGQKLHIKKQKLEQMSEKIEELDHYVAGFYKKHKTHFFEILFLQCFGRLLGVVEIYIIASLFGLPISLMTCFFLTSLTILINFCFVFVPGSMGVMESGYGALFYLLNLNPAHGVAIQLMRRVRTFVWIGIGLLIILLYRPKKPAHAFQPH